MTMRTTNALLTGWASLCLAACATTNVADTTGAQAAGAANLPFSSPECLAAKLPQGEPFPAASIPAAAQAGRQSGTVAIRYDVVAGAAQNLQVVTSSPAGLYDAAAMQHVARYRVPSKPTVRGCVSIIEVKF